ncbi:hypothetical protein DFH28DRAFT_351553 [Melampsora americana]|nr:hypothetical protein DFH28DRAFT_351553 [Melampsora americana]
MASLWTEHRSPTGRLYWYNATTSTSSWERPDDLKTPSERALASTPWKEYQTAEGRKYWHHTETKETTWTLPDVVREAIEKAAASAPPAPVPSTPGPPMSFTAPTPAPAPAPPHPTFVPASQTPAMAPSMKPPGSITPNTSSAPAGFVPPAASLPPRPVTSILHSAPVPTPVTTTLPDFKTPEEAERAFVGLLRVKGVNPTWTWEQTMRDIITEPLYKALDTLAARKAAWEKFIDNERKREKENREKNITRVRASWNAGLESLSEEKTITNEEGVEIKLPGAPPKLWWTYERLKREMELRIPDVWKLGRDDEERKILWEDYLADLRQKETTAANQLRGRQQEKLTDLLRAHEEKLDISGDLETMQWRVAQEAILRSEFFQNDDDLRKMDDLDMLMVFEEEVKRAEKESSEAKAKQKEDKRRTYRKTRAAYIQLLHELKLNGEIQPGTMWKEVYPLIEADERYQNLVGNPGSSPLELFWDLVDDLDQETEEKAKIVQDILADQQKTITETTELDHFLSWLDGHTDPTVLDKKTLTHVFMMLHDEVVRIAKEERRRFEKRLRNQIEDLRYALKKLSPPIELDTPYEEATQRFSHLQEYKSLEGQEDGRKEAYNRYMERLKEKATLEEKRTKRKDEDMPRGDYRKKSLLQHSDDEGSIISSSKRKKRDLLDEDKPNRHSSPRSGRREDIHSSPRGPKDSREERDQDRSKERDRNGGRDRDYDRDKDSARDRTRNKAPGRGTDVEPEAERDHSKEDIRNVDSDRSRNRDTDRDRSRDTNRDRDRARDRDHRDRTKDRPDERDRSRTSISQTDDRDRRRKDFDNDRHSQRHHRSRKDRDYDERDRDRHRSNRYEDDDGPASEKKSEGIKDGRGDSVDKRARSTDVADNVNRPINTEEERELKRVKINETVDTKLVEKSDGEEGELDG